ncbi:MAG: hypothetical protein P4M11_06685 [Candidatus Pacebacteria bacterium]|nr:hypothetical protein [Candidatus Paceibacterota bacterium]
MLIVLSVVSFLAEILFVVFILFILGAALPLLSLCIGFSGWMTLKKSLIVLMVIGSMVYIGTITYGMLFMAISDSEGWLTTKRYCIAFVVYMVATGLINLGAYIPQFFLYRMSATVSYAGVPSAAYVPPTVLAQQHDGCAPPMGTPVTIATDQMKSSSS